MKNKKIAVIAVAALVIVIVIIVRSIFLGGDASQDASSQKSAVQVRVSPATVESISEMLELTGSVVPQRIARLASPAEGPVTNLKVREGDRVKAGDILLSIGRREGIEAQITSYQESVKKEEENLNRTKQLVESQALPGEELDRAKAAYENARAQLINAMEAVQDYSVIAPWSGIVSKVNVRDGDYVVPRAPLVEVYDPANLIIEAAVPERYSAQLRNGLNLTVRLDAFPDSTFKATIKRIYPFLEDRMRTRTIEAEIDARIAILPGMFARLQMPLNTIDNAVVVPSQAVLVQQSGGRVVFVVDADTVSQRTVEVGIEQDNRVQVVSGIASGETIVVAGNEKLKPGAPVRVIQPASKPKDTGGGR
ncbi:MAG: efflux RND transporter periplasmic adaptor subunit [Candidatus Abyssobacteria bacterium SURF_17]|uniref:Efflux RND transporter periplasmic adaptor subunit n=1 Tax=Candidatus Abyssobacteria bacterium SURF_17 TaxID=2093361 RepID=A0A419EZ21_9BACT|nr:MAG: efflux RND transporter periplasmic adaptor subunit [Candidatus Abyssubacteria bacterium SURF_17]